ncbi:hypothetical protein PVAND_017711 [Polypedilum vanderplanki]|uniref:Uncharacterized protein n=1 Tax=Polypedilum vanderplanki TaxID=319348 RepID=A0A9J6B981_POLVA|nr:hypothetical protein PVAND_017711 [Polypedilum vanderplanki]
MKHTRPSVPSPSSSSSSNTPISSPSHQQQQTTATKAKSAASTSNYSSLMAKSAVTASPNISGGSKKKSKQKAYSDPKMSSEIDASNGSCKLSTTIATTYNTNCDVFGQPIVNKDSSDGISPTIDGRPLPNSCATQMHFPLITTILLLEME